MKNTSTLTFFCGKMGAGKSTKAKSLAIENNALLLSEDEWLAAHYPDQIHDFDDYLRFSALIKPFVKSHVQNILQTGTHVVMDFPANTVRQRAWFKALCAEVGCEHQLVFLDLSDEQCLAQIAKRRAENPERAQFDTEAVFRQVTQYFEPPSADEALNEVKPENFRIEGITPFIPAKDFGLSRHFYLALGFVETVSIENAVLLELGGYGFWLQDYYVQDFADNSMLCLYVESLSAWHKKLAGIDWQGTYGSSAKMLSGPHEQEGAMMMQVTDPSGVLWHIRQNA